MMNRRFIETKLTDELTDGCVNYSIVNMYSMNN